MISYCSKHNRNNEAWSQISAEAGFRDINRLLCLVLPSNVLWIRAFWRVFSKWEFPSGRSIFKRAIKPGPCWCWMGKHDGSSVSAVGQVPPWLLTSRWMEGDSLSRWSLSRKGHAESRRDQTRCAVTRFMIEVGHQCCNHMNFKGTMISVTQLLLFQGQGSVSCS